MIKVAVAIVVYNGRQDLPACLKSLAMTKLSGIKMDLVIVDNASTDDSLAYIKTYANATKLIQNKENKFFAQANNQAWQWARQYNYDYLVLLNQDTEVDPMWLQELVNVAESQENVGAVQAKLKLMSDRDRINSIGNSLHYLGLGYSTGEGQTDQWKDVDPFKINYASGAAVIFPMAVLKETGLFYNQYQLYHEDTDVSWRIRLTGREIYVAPKSIVYHNYEWNPKPYHYYYIERNRLLLLFSNYKYATLIILLPIGIALEIGKFIFAVKNKWWAQQLKAWWHAIKMLPLAIKWHKRAAKLRKVSDRKLLIQFAKTVEFAGVRNGLLERFGNPLFQIYYWLLWVVVWW